MGLRPGTELTPGTAVAGYRIEALIGRGGMGAVYRAAEERLGRKVALKLIAPELAQDERFRDRFLRESKIAASLDHPHVIPIYHAGEENGVLFLAMRYVEGTDLAKLLTETGRLEPKRALEILGQVAEALDAAHDKGLVHRDVKPSNVLIARAADMEHCYLADFGLTKRTGSLSGVSAPGDVVGTLEYVAPEQITGEPIDSRTDIYSLGCVLYECLTGQPPFPRATDVALLWAHVHEEPNRPIAGHGELPRSLDAVLARALAKDAERRYQTCGELVAAARAALGLGAVARSSKRVPAWSVLVAGSLAAVASLGLFLALRSDPGGLSSVSADAVGVIDADSGRIVAEIAVGARPEGVAVGESSVWVANFEDGNISQIEPETRRSIRTISMDGYPSDVVVGSRPQASARSSLGGDEVVWVGLPEVRDDSRAPAIPPTPHGEPPILSSEFFVPKLSWFEPRSTTHDSATLEGLACRSSDVTVAVGTRAVWFACDSYLARVDPRTGEATLIGYEAALVAQPTAVPPDFSDLAFGLGSLWLANRATNTVTEIDPATSRGVREITVGQAPSAVAVGRGSVWVTSLEDDEVTRIDVPRGGRAVTTTKIPVGDGPVDVAVGQDGVVWIVNSRDGTVSRLDPSTNEVVATINVGNEPQRVAVGQGMVWVTVRGADL
jgi:YVTN family beta-propeller protein